MTKTVELIIGACIIIPFLLISIWIFISSYLLIDKIEEYFKNSKVLLNHQRIFHHLGLLGVSIRSCSIVIYILFAKLFEKRGLVSRQDIESIPTGLKLNILIPWVFGYVWFLALIILWFFTV